jgi:hypothetical protein
MADKGPDCPMLQAIYESSNFYHLLLTGHFILACHHKTDVEVKDVVVRETEEAEEVPPPPPHLATSVKTLQEWLFELCDTEKPAEPITAYNFGLFESAGSYTIYLIGSKEHNKDQYAAPPTGFQSAPKYYTLL